MYFVQVLTACVLLAAFVVSGSANPAARLIDGQKVDDLGQFPFYVRIIVLPSGEKCGGSILNKRWILTSAQCVKNSVRLELSFGKINEDDRSAPFFSISVKSVPVYPLPANYDDVALVKIPLSLIFSDTIAPVSLSRTPVDSLTSKFAVLAGFDDALTRSDDKLKFGTFVVLEPSVCETRLALHILFDGFSQLCAEGWNEGAGTACETDYGSGLIANWLSTNELIGIYSKFSPTCDSSLPGVYTYVAKYVDWIEATIQG